MLILRLFKNLLTFYPFYSPFLAINDGNIEHNIKAKESVSYSFSPLAKCLKFTENYNTSSELESSIIPALSNMDKNLKKNKKEDHMI